MKSSRNTRPPTVRRSPSGGARPDLTGDITPRRAGIPWASKARKTNLATTPVAPCRRPFRQNGTRNVRRRDLDGLLLLPGPVDPHIPIPRAGIHRRSYAAARRSRSSRRNRARWFQVRRRTSTRTASLLDCASGVGGSRRHRLGSAIDAHAASLHPAVCRSLLLNKAKKDSRGPHLGGGARFIHDARMRKPGRTLAVVGTSSGFLGTGVDEPGDRAGGAAAA